MKDTAKRIRAYKAALPGLKERLAAVALLLVVSTVMMISATFAWITLSRAPEVTGINTTISGNGNLEIALSDKDGLAPDEFDVDESLTKGVNVTLSNLEWGNLINLSDPSYGIDNLALRPAQLNTANLLGSPLWGAVYAEDGRITALDSNYAYAMFNGTEFKTSNEYGVRAIASYTATISGETQAQYKEMRDAVQAASSVVNQKYADVIKNFDSLGTMISKYAQDKLDKSDPATNLAPYLVDVLKVYNALDATMAAQKDAYVALANFQLYMHANNTGSTYTPVTWADLEAGHAQYNTTSADAVSQNGAISLVNLSTFIKDLNLLKTDISYLEKYRDEYQTNSTAYYWASGGDANYNINNMISRLIDYSNMTIDLNDDGTEKKVSSLGASDATALLGANNKSRKAYVYNGILRRVEDNIIGPSYRLNGNAQCTIRVTYVLTITVKGKAYTKASGPSTFESSFEKAKGTDLVAADQVAQDTYGMAVDLWVRTNAESTCLTLEGATAVDENGNIIRYDGANRIWGRVPSTDTLYTTESTSQGGGSCYIYYADTPEDMARSLDLLDSMKVAFVSQGGTLLATAEMDTVNYCAVNGRVTVPLVLDTNTKTTYTYTDSMNQEVVGKAITTLTYDAAERITAIIYLDGTHLTNDNVLAASEIQGQLNIQFGSSKDLQTIGSNDLIDDVRTVTAAVNKDNINFDAAVTEEDRKVTVTVKINGTTATEVQAFFVRAINSTQGSREKERNFTKQADGTWTSDYVFNAPGDYYLRYVRLNGVDYALANPLHVTVSGFALKSVTWDHTENSVVVRTSDSTFSTKVTVEFASNDLNKLPNTVQARFVRTDGNTVNVPLSRGTDGKWTGTGNFTTSGVYKLEYLVYTTSKSTNGIYKDLGDWKKTLDLALGMYVEVKDMTGKLEENYKSDGVYDKTVEVRIYDNAGNAIEELKGAKLYYSNNGSASNTINSDLTWNAGKYDAILPIKTAGRWMFGYVDLGSQYLTKASSSPTYTIISPDPVAYDDSSETTYNTPNGGGIQFVPLTNDATINGIKLLHADTADVQVVVYNDVAQEYYSLSGDRVNVVSGTVKLPTYTTGGDADGNPDQSTATTQDGTWSVAAIILTNCYGEDKAYHGETNPIIWAGTDEISRAYVESQKDTAGFHVTAYKDFSKLATQVSSSLNVVFTQKGQEVNGQTIALGGSDYVFMHEFNVNELGMNVKVTDGSGKAIPADKVQVTLDVSYTPPTDASYGYAVQAQAKQAVGIGSFQIGFNTEKDGGEAGLREVSTAGDVWQYVGQYKVEKLTVTTSGGATKVYTVSDQIGLPSMYTVTTAGYSENDLKLVNVAQPQTPVYGKSGNSVNGTFLQAQNLSKAYSVAVTVNKVDYKQTMYAEVQGATAKMVLTYEKDSSNKDDGTGTKYGYYTVSGTDLQNLELEMKQVKDANGNVSYVAPESVTLLAGVYKAKYVVTLGGVTLPDENLNDIKVYSKQPDVTMALTEKTPKSVTVNVDGSIYYGKNGTFLANNVITDNSHSAILFAHATQFEGRGQCAGHKKYSWSEEKTYHYSDNHSAEFVDYVMPEIVFTLSGGGKACSDFTITIAGNEDRTSVKFSSGESQSEAIKIGTDEAGKTEWKNDTTENGTETVYYPTETLKLVDEQVITSISAVYNGNTYTITLRNPLSIVERNTAIPSLTIDMSNNPGFVIPDKVVGTNDEEYNVEKVGTDLYEIKSKDGREFSITLPELRTENGSNVVYLNQEERKLSETTSDRVGPNQNIEDMEGKVEWRDSDKKEWYTEYKYTQTADLETESVKHGWTALSKTTHRTGVLTRHFYELGVKREIGNVTLYSNDNVQQTVTTSYAVVTGSYTFTGWNVGQGVQNGGTIFTVSSNQQISPQISESEVVSGYKDVIQVSEGRESYAYSVGRENVYDVQENLALIQDRVRGTTYCSYIFYAAEGKCNKGGIYVIESDAELTAKSNALAIGLPAGAGNYTDSKCNVGDKKPTTGTRGFTYELESVGFVANKTTTSVVEYDKDHNPLNP